MRYALGPEVHGEDGERSVESAIFLSGFWPTANETRETNSK